MLRERSEAQECARRTIAEVVERENRERGERVREQERAAREKLMGVWGGKVESSQSNYLEKLEKERVRLKEKTRSITKMEAKEGELMARLQMTQARQREVTTMLEGAIKATQGMRSRVKNG